MGNLKYVLFDLDGTLWASGPGITRSVQYALRCLGIDEPDLKNLTSFVGPPLNVEFARRFDLDEEQTKFAVKKFRERYDATGVFECELYPGVREMLRTLSDAGLTLAASSGKPQPLVDRLMAKFEIGGSFRVILGGRYEDEFINRTGVGNKQRIIGETLRRLGVRDLHTQSGSEAPAAARGEAPAGVGGGVIMVGDTKYDVLGAARNDVGTIGAAYGYGGREELTEAGADAIAEDVPQLTEMLLSMAE